MSIKFVISDDDDDDNDDDNVQSPPSKWPRRSIGRGNITVEFFSAEIEFSV